jgi:hypothetical protein
MPAFLLAETYREGFTGAAGPGLGDKNRNGVHLLYVKLYANLQA